MVAVPMRHDNKVQLQQVDAFGLRIVRKDVWVVAGIEQDALSGVFDQRGITPVLLHRRRLAECIVQDSNLWFGVTACGGARSGSKRCRTTDEKKNCQIRSGPEFAVHRVSPWLYDPITRKTSKTC